MLKAGQLLEGQETYLENQMFSRVQYKDRAINEIVLNLNKNNLQFISLLDLLCKANQCLSQVSYPNNEPMAFDYAHLTGSGSIKVSSLIFDSINLKDKRD